MRDVALRQHERIGFGRGRDDVEFVLRVELPQGLDRDVDRRGDLPEVHQPVDADGIRGQWDRGFGEFDAVLAVVGVGIRRTDECGDVAARFAGQVVVDVPECAPVAAGAGYCLVDVARAAVVGGDGQRPVVIDSIEVFQVAAGGLCRTDRVAAFVDQRVDFQSVAFARRGHELPQAYGAHRRHGRGGKRRFDDRQCPQFDGELLLEQFVLDEREIVLRHAQNAADRAVARIGVAVDITPYDAVVRQLDGRDERPQPLDIDRIGGRAFGRAVDQDVVVEKFLVGIPALPFAPHGDQRIGLFCREPERHVVVLHLGGVGKFGLLRLGGGLLLGHGGGRGCYDGFGLVFLLVFFAGAAVECRGRDGDCQ